MKLKKILKHIFLFVFFLLLINSLFVNSLAQEPTLTTTSSNENIEYKHLSYQECLKEKTKTECDKIFNEFDKMQEKAKNNAEKTKKVFDKFSKNTKNTGNIKEEIKTQLRSRRKLTKQEQEEINKLEKEYKRCLKVSSKEKCVHILKKIKSKLNIQSTYNTGSNKKISVIKINKVLKNKYEECLKEKSKEECDKIIRIAKKRLLAINNLKNSKKQPRIINKKLQAIKTKIKLDKKNLLRTFKKLENDRIIKKALLIRKIKIKDINLIRKRINEILLKQKKLENKVKEQYKKQILMFKRLKHQLRNCSKFKDQELNKTCIAINNEIKKVAIDSVKFNINLTKIKLIRLKYELNKTLAFDSDELKLIFNEIDNEINKLNELYNKLDYSLNKTQIQEIIKKLKLELKEIRKKYRKINHKKNLRVLGLILVKLHKLEARLTNITSNYDIRDDNILNAIAEFKRHSDNITNLYDKAKDLYGKLSENKIENAAINLQLYKIKRNMLKELSKAIKSFNYIVRELKKKHENILNSLKSTKPEDVISNAEAESIIDELVKSNNQTNTSVSS